MQLFTHFAGQNGQAQFDSDDFVAQCKQALQKIVNKLACAQAGLEHILRMTWYVKKNEYLDRALVEIEATAVVPD